MRPLPELPRSWLSIELPGYREHPGEYATYSDFSYQALPPIERRLDDELRWLLHEPPVRPSLADVDGATITRATAEDLGRLAGSALALPRSFLTFVGSDVPQARVRSCTDCYLDLADFAVPVVGGGSLVHFLSDSQWVLHWLLYAGPDGAEAVVASDRPLGYADEGNETMRCFDPSRGEASVCAQSFSDFLYRFWIENEIWFRLANPDDEPMGLTEEQRRYAEHYAHTDVETPD